MNSAARFSTDPSIRLLHDQRRGGKSAALHRAVQHASHNTLIFSDANTVLNRQAIRHIARHYADQQTGGVAGEKKVLAAAGVDEVGAGEGLYWKYESFLKKIDSECYSVVGAAGELFSVKKELFERLDDNILLDDFVVSLKVAQKRRRVIYEPGAFATELPSFSLHDESKRKVRIAAGGFQAMWLLRGLLCFWRHPRLSFLYISHRVLRWTLTPLCLILALIANMVLVYTAGHWYYQLLLAAQLFFYGGALAAKFSPSLGARFRLLKLCYYFVFMNVSVIQGFFRFLGRRQTGVWEKARRQQVGA
jgi:biofilm PGA synthesis N-glycosyltransferase PgaC